MPGRWLSADHPEGKPLPEGWTDEIVIHTTRKMSNGTLTVIALVNVYDEKNRRRFTGERVMNLEKDES